MDLAFIDVPLWMLITVPMLILLYLYGTIPLREQKRLGVPGPIGVPFFGNALELYSENDQFYALIDRWKRKYGRIFSITLFHEPLLIVVDPEALRQILVKEFNNYSDRFFLGKGHMQQHIVMKAVFFAEGENWHRLRKITTPLFSGARIKLLMHHINRTARQLTDNLVKRAEEGSRPEAKNTFAAYSLDVLGGTAFGINVDSLSNPENALNECAKKLTGMNGLDTKIRVFLGCTFPVIGRIFKFFGVGLFSGSDVKFFTKFVSELIRKRKNQDEKVKQCDFIQFLMEAEADASEDIVGSRSLSPIEVGAQGMIIMIAGYEAMATCLQYLSYELALHQDIQRKVVTEIEQVIGTEDEPTYEQYQNLKYTEAVINEILRKYPPLHLISRKNLQATNLKGFNIPANTGIFIPYRSIAHDPEFFENPEEFNPDRFLGESKQAIDPITFLAFGFGPRQCMGLRLATLVVKAAVVHMLRRITITDVTPKTLIIEDYTPMLIPQQLIKLVLETKAS